MIPNKYVSIKPTILDAPKTEKENQRDASWLSWLVAFLPISMVSYKSKPVKRESINFVRRLAEAISISAGEVKILLYRDGEFAHSHITCPSAGADMRVFKSVTEARVLCRLWGRYCNAFFERRHLEFEIEFIQISQALGANIGVSSCMLESNIKVIPVRDIFFHVNRIRRDSSSKVSQERLKNTEHCILNVLDRFVMPRSYATEGYHKSPHSRLYKSSVDLANISRLMQHKSL